MNTMSRNQGRPSENINDHFVFLVNLIKHMYLPKGRELKINKIIL